MIITMNAHDLDDNQTSMDLQMGFNGSIILNIGDADDDADKFAACVVDPHELIGSLQLLLTSNDAKQVK